MRKILAVLFSILLICCSGVLLTACGEPPHEHNFNLQIIGEDYLASDATCESPAKYYYVCTCWEHSTETYEYGSALGHSYTNYVYNNDEACEADGTETAQCDNHCGESHTRTKVGSALEHSYTNYVYNNDAACEVDGTETASCDHGCGESYTRIRHGSMLNHLYTDYKYNNVGEYLYPTIGIASCDRDCGKTDYSYDKSKYVLAVKADANPEKFYEDTTNYGKNIKAMYAEQDATFGEVLVMETLGEGVAHGGHAVTYYTGDGVNLENCEYVFFYVYNGGSSTKQLLGKFNGRINDNVAKLLPGAWTRVEVEASTFRSSGAYMGILNFDFGATYKFSAFFGMTKAGLVS